MTEFKSFVTAYTVQSEHRDLSTFLQMYDVIIELMLEQGVSLLSEEDIKKRGV